MGNLTVNEKGKALVEHHDGFNYPVELTFECVNDFVHSRNVHFEELQSLCLGLISEYEKIKAETLK